MSTTLPDVGQVFVPQTASELRDQWLRDYRVGMIEAGVADPNILPGSEPYIRATCIANMMLGAFANIEIKASDTSELTAQGEALDSIREAIGLPEVSASESAGKIKVFVSKYYTTIIADGTQLVSPSGRRFAVVGTWNGVVNNSQVDVICIDKGSNTNVLEGVRLRWLSPPVGVFGEAEVVSPGLTGGSDVETDERKRERILNRRQNLPAGGNAAYLIELAEGSTSAIQKAFCYPALGGPGSAKVVVQKAVDITNEDFSREVPAGQVELAAMAILAEAPEPIEIVTQSVIDEDTDVALGLVLPDSSNSGSSSGWYNYTNVFPVLTTNFPDSCAVLSVVSDNEFLIELEQGTPLVNSTKIMWWNPTTQAFVISTVISRTVDFSSQVIAVDIPFTGIQAGDYISPYCYNANSYRDSWLTIMSELGPGENTTSVHRLPRARRNPGSQFSYPSDLGTAQLSKLINAHTEILDCAYTYRSKTTPTVPANVSTAPNVLKLNKFGIYKKI
jgi:uncharacterized phage protein gp47/JayE